MSARGASRGATLAPVAPAGERPFFDPQGSERVRAAIAGTDARLTVVLSALGVLLAGVFCFFAFVVPRTSVRLERPSAALIDELSLWSSLASASVPVPEGQWAIGASLILSSLFAFALYGVALYTTWGRRAGRRVVYLAGLIAVFLFAVSALALPNVNTDIYNYVVTGRVAAVHDANPYTVAPDEFPFDPVYPYAEHRYTEHPDVKLPAWMLINVPLAKVAGDDPVVNLLVYRFVFLAFNVACLVLVAAIAKLINPRYALAAVVAWGWSPVVALFGTSKVDTIMVAFLLVAVLLLVKTRRRSAAVALTLSAFVKLITLPFAAAYWLHELARRQWRRLAVATAVMCLTVLAVYLPFGTSPDLLLDHLGLIQRRGSGNPVGEGASSGGAARALLAAGYVFLIVWVGLTQGDTTRRLLRGWGLLAVYFALFLLPFGLPWYLMAPIAVASIAVDWRLLLLTGLLSFSSFLVYTWDSMSSPAFPLPDIVAVSRGFVYLAPVGLGALAVIALLVRRGNRPAQST